MHREEQRLAEVYKIINRTHKCEQFSSEFYHWMGANCEQDNTTTIFDYRYYGKCQAAAKSIKPLLNVFHNLALSTCNKLFS